MPFTRALDLQMRTGGRNSCRGKLTFTTWDGWLQSNCVWITPWVELDSAAEVARYRRFLDNYAADQQRAGRFNWAPNVRLRDVAQWLDHQQVVPPESRISLIVAVAFFAICLVNTIGLLLAKFLRRAGEIGVRRALGATRREIYAQYLIEAGTVGLAGGVLGLLLTAAGRVGRGHAVPAADRAAGAPRSFADRADPAGGDRRDRARGVLSRLACRERAAGMAAEVELRWRSMQIKPILVALRRHKAGTVLIALQIALTLAIVCNALFIIHQRLANMSDDSGVDEANVFVIKQPLGRRPPDAADRRAGAGRPARVAAAARRARRRSGQRLSAARRRLGQLHHDDARASRADHRLGGVHRRRAPARHAGRCA